MTNPSASSALGKFIWYDQMSNDLQGAEAFYTKVVGWTLAPNSMNDQRYTLLKAGERMVGGLMPIPAEAKGAQPAWMGYIAVDDVQAYADKVKAAGGMIHRPPAPIPNVGTFAVAADPDGAGFLLFKPNSSEGMPPPPPARQAISAGTSCTAATRKARSPSTPACSAGRRMTRWTWAPWANTRSSPSRTSRWAA